MSDVHLDFEYVEGANAECSRPVCCREGDGWPTRPQAMAPKFGHPNCDAPKIVFESAVEYISSWAAEDKPDVIFWTGDNTPHDVWEQSIDDNVIYTKEITQFLETHMPDVPVMAALGNHEFYPVNVMSFEEQDPVLEELAHVWDHYIDKDAMKTFSR